MTDHSGDAPVAEMIATVLRDGQHDEVAVEEPLEIRVDGDRLWSACAHRDTTRNSAWVSLTAKA